MKGNTGRIVILACAGVLLCVARASGQSLYGLNYIGEHRLPGSVRHRALGMSAVAVPDSSNAATANHASIADIPRMTFSVIQSLSLSRITTADESADQVRFMLPEVMIAVPIRRGVVFSTGYMTRFEGRGEFSFLRSSPEFPTSFDVHERSGSLFSVPLILAVKAGDWLNLSGELQIERGSITNEISVEFAEAGYNTVFSARKRRYSGTSWAASMLLRLHPRVYIGAMFDDRISYDVYESFDYTREDLDSTATWDFELPEAYGAGFALGLTSRWWLTSHFWSREAPEATGYPHLEGSIRDEMLIAVGLERRRIEEGGFFSRVPLRMGYYENRWHLEFPAGEPVISRFITLGSGFNLPGGPGIIDLSVEFGLIGTVDGNGLGERVVRFGMGLSFSETWSRRKEARRY